MESSAYKEINAFCVFKFGKVNDCLIKVTPSSLKSHKLQQ